MRIKKLFITAIIIYIMPTVLMALEEPVVHVVGVRVVGPGYGLNGTELKAFHERSGTTLALVVETPKERKIVEVDKDNCSLMELIDDSGHDMRDGIHWDSFPEISEDGGSALIDVSSKVRPSQDASRIHARGKIKLRIASSTITQKVDKLKLEVGNEVHLKGEGIRVMKVQADDEGLNLVIQISRELKDLLKDIRFMTLDGNQVEVWGRGSFTFGNAAQMEYNIDLKTKVESLKLEIDLWQGLESLDVFFDLTTGLGLGN
jgi:hypothetical protein